MSTSEPNKQAAEPAWMTTARRLEAEHREQSAQQMREDHLSSPHCSEWYRERDRKDGMTYWRHRQASAVNAYRKRPRMDDTREGMNDSERAAYDKGLLDGLQAAEAVVGRFRSPIHEVTLAVAKIDTAIWDVGFRLQERYGTDVIRKQPRTDADEHSQD
jgi:hypothetical protein